MMAFLLLIPTTEPSDGGILRLKTVLAIITLRNISEDKKYYTWICQSFHLSNKRWQNLIDKDVP